MLTPFSLRYLMFVSPRRNQSSSWMMDCVNLWSSAVENHRRADSAPARRTGEYVPVPGAVGFEFAVLHDVAEQFEMLNHAEKLNHEPRRNTRRNLKISERGQSPVRSAP